jgi:hypothetical protein
MYKDGLWLSMAYYVTSIRCICFLCFYVLHVVHTCMYSNYICIVTTHLYHFFAIRDHFAIENYVTQFVDVFLLWHFCRLG